MSRFEYHEKNAFIAWVSLMFVHHWRSYHRRGAHRVQNRILIVVIWRKNREVKLHLKRSFFFCLHCGVYTLRLIILIRPISVNGRPYHLNQLYIIFFVEKISNKKMIHLKIIYKLIADNVYIIYIYTIRTICIRYFIFDLFRVAFRSKHLTK